ncbi:mannose-1-phosphate guanylyltransferase [Echinicola vietnamensis]|uniref:Mannose-1-phosphate guanylyltransferase n=1 Tax=Echinicola vietnamensis (strain DSM 17526 / LMG 23754 / KMM 6221) TaxID=926556 RepID=L0G5B4_ECHVK|nr:mannose-1-phosphate guanylyltransferase [Echinicola vietnamensis]AGA80010.1 mannose-1-phosphate guanylyltransferase [Echinicola vietnamensis DSM 17526]
MSKIVNVVLSGGVGSRLWPLSRKSRPKQYLPIFDGETLFQKTVARNRSIADEVLVVGNKDNYELSRKDMAASKLSQYRELVEACPRNTAAAIAFSAFHCHEEDVLFVTPSDHLITPGTAYQTAVKRAIQLANEGNIVTFGLKPSHPETGYGYIEAVGEDVKDFHEKPEQEKADNFFKQGGYLWNSGMFCFQAGVFLAELRRYETEIFDQAYGAYMLKKEIFLPETESLRIPSLSVDYAVMERSKKIKVVAADFEWSDMGSFEAIYDYLGKKGHHLDDSGNMVIGTNTHIEFTGLTNTLLIFTKDAVLALKKENSQEVKDVFQRLENERPELVM